jgi:poly(3-hydroxyoctanoate) depolymerase
MRSCSIALFAGAIAAVGCDSGALSNDAGGEPTNDAGDLPVDEGDGPAVESRCTVAADYVSCTHNITRLTAGTSVRDVYWQTPTTPVPPGGYPVVVMYQGSFGGPALTWEPLGPEALFGGFYQGLLQAVLLDHGFTVVAPSAAIGIAWQTNSGVPWSLTTDKPVIDKLLEEIAAGTYGPADMERLHATGISSGGYMTSRMAVSYPGVFRSLAINAGSYATCAGVLCSVPDEMPADHPSTLFLAGGNDTTVPLSTVQEYYNELMSDGFETSLVVDPASPHAWLSSAPEAIPAWFEAH